MSLRIYVAGPMSGLPEFNYPAFNTEADRLRSMGFHVENPASNPVPPCGTWQGYMRLALAQLITCQAIALLPGWNKSRGATIEHRLALELGLSIIYHEPPANADLLSGDALPSLTESTRQCLADLGAAA